MKFSKLLAKSLPSHESWQGAATYVGHISAVMRSANVLAAQLEPIIRQHLGLSNIAPDYFINTVKLGAYLHDWGKANQHFQVMVRLKDLKYCKDDKELQQQKSLNSFWQGINHRQMIRHEILSGILAFQVPSFRAWLEECPNADFLTAVWAAMGHHLKIGGKKGRTTDQITEIPDGTGADLEIYTHHDHFTALLDIGVRDLGLSNSLPERPKERWTKDELKDAMNQLHEEFVDFAENFSSENQRFIAAVKATVLTADIAGSALPNTQYKIEDWLQKALELVLTADDIQSLVEQRLGQNPLRDFQRRIAETNSRVTLVQAGCGTGKTVAAYAWAKNVAVGLRLFFGYPTTGTASQGYLDYAAETNIEKLLMHSRAAIDLEAVLFSNEAKYELNQEDTEDPERIDARLASFNAWQAKLIVCTVDAVLGLIQNNRKPLYAWPAICQSAFVFDEVHAYDQRLFGTLLRFLKAFRGAPTLLMSASFTEGQITAIRQVVEQELQETLQLIPGPQNLEALPRYTLHQIPEPSAAWAQVEKALKDKQRVLWVTNTVSDCVAIYRDAARKLKALGIKPLIYHSRYRYTDRVEKHKAVVDAFKSDEAVVAITTQVCEMSLDLSAHLLVTAMAPAPALIQRLGRLNRKVEEDTEGNIHLVSGRVCPAFIYPWTEKYPYEKPELETGQHWLNRLPSGEISQQQLSEAAARLGSEVPQAVHSNWLDGNWRSLPGALRDAGHTLTVLLEQDLPQIRKAACQPGNSFGIEAQRWTVPIRLMNSYTTWEREGVYPVAPKAVVRYSEETGAELCK